MTAYLVRRLLYAILTLLGITVVVFSLVHLVPGDPMSVYLMTGRGGATVPPAVVEQMRHERGLDRPLAVQYARWLRDVVTLDFGDSLFLRRSVKSLVSEKLPNTLALNGLALALALVLAIPLGIASGVKPNRPFDRASGFVLLALYSLPNFWVAMMLVRFFAVRFPLFPLYGITSENYSELSAAAQYADRLWHLALPVVTLAYGQLAIFAKFTRSAVMESVRKDFVVTARAKGAAEWRVTLHAVRAALVPLITLLGMTVPFLFSGSVIVEKIFEWDGIGRLYVDSALNRDFPVVMALTVLTAVITLLSFVVTDVAYTLADPRVRLGEKS